MSQRSADFVGSTFRMKTGVREGEEIEIGRGSSQHVIQSPWKLQLPISQGALRPDCGDYLQFSPVGTMVLTISSPWIGEGNGNPLQYSCLENPMDGGAWQAAVHGVTRSQTLLSEFTLTFHFPALEKDMATHSSALAWRIPGTGEPGGLLSMGSHRVGHD